jgi:hypothetical protein
MALMIEWSWMSLEMESMSNSPHRICWDFIEFEGTKDICYWATCKGSVRCLGEVFLTSHCWLELQILPVVQQLLSKWYFQCSWGCRVSRVHWSIQFGAR